jgi:hypothetical protein
MTNQLDRDLGPDSGSAYQGSNPCLKANIFNNLAVVQCFPSVRTCLLRGFLKRGTFGNNKLSTRAIVCRIGTPELPFTFPVSSTTGKALKMLVFERTCVRIVCADRASTDPCGVVTKDLIHIKSIDVGAVPLVSSHSYVRSVDFRLYRPLFLFFPDAGRFAIGDPRSTPLYR